MMVNVKMIFIIILFRAVVALTVNQSDIWTRTFPVGSWSEYQSDVLLGSKNNSYLVLSIQPCTGSKQCTFLSEIGFDGTVLWNREYYHATDDSFLLDFCSTTSDLGYICVGNSNFKSATMKISSTGIMEWTRFFWNGESYGYQAIEDLSTSQYMTIFAIDGSPWNLGVAKLDSDGSILWKKYIDHAGREGFRSAIKDPKGGLIAFGFAGNPISFGVSSSGRDPFVMKWRGNGTVESFHALGCNGDTGEFFRGMLTSNGDIIGVGYIECSSTSAQPLIVKFNSTYDFLWGFELSVGLTGTLTDIVEDVDDGNYIVVGKRDTTSVIFIAKIDASNGDIIWSKKFNGITWSMRPNLAVSNTPGLFVVTLFVEGEDGVDYRMVKTFSLLDPNFLSCETTDWSISTYDITQHVDFQHSKEITFSVTDGTYSTSDASLAMTDQEYSGEDYYAKFEYRCSKYGYCKGGDGTPCVCDSGRTGMNCEFSENQKGVQFSRLEYGDLVHVSVQDISTVFGCKTDFSMITRSNSEFGFYYGNWESVAVQECHYLSVASDGSLLYGRDVNGEYWNTYQWTYPGEVFMASSANQVHTAKEDTGKIRWVLSNYLEENFYVYYDGGTTAVTNAQSGRSGMTVCEDGDPEEQYMVGLNGNLYKFEKDSNKAWLIVNDNVELSWIDIATFSGTATWLVGAEIDGSSLYMMRFPSQWVAIPTLGLPCVGQIHNFSLADDGTLAVLCGDLRDEGYPTYIASLFNHTCYGIHAAEPTVCSGNGVCASQDFCVCFEKRTLDISHTVTSDCQYIINETKGFNLELIADGGELRYVTVRNSDTLFGCKNDFSMVERTHVNGIMDGSWSAVAVTECHGLSVASDGTLIYCKNDVDGHWGTYQWTYPGEFSMTSSQMTRLHAASEDSQPKVRYAGWNWAELAWQISDDGATPQQTGDALDHICTDDFSDFFKVDLDYSLRKWDSGTTWIEVNSDVEVHLIDVVKESNDEIYLFGIGGPGTLSLFMMRYPSPAVWVEIPILSFSEISGGIMDFSVATDGTIAVLAGEMGDDGYNVYIGNVLDHQCFGIQGNDTNVCNGQGFCVDEGSCVCFYRFLTHEQCYPVCFGVDGNETDVVCSGRGTCNYLTDPPSSNRGKCDCEYGFSGYNCEISEDRCFSVDKTESSLVCSGHGLCSVGNDSCICTDGYVGKNCSLLPTPYHDYYISFGHDTGSDWPKVMAFDSSTESVYVGLYTTSFNAEDDIQFSKLSTDGVLEWTKSTDESAKLYQNWGLMLADDGDLIFSAYREVGSVASGYVSRYSSDSSFTERWTTAFECDAGDGGDSVWIREIRPAQNGSIAIIGFADCMGYTKNIFFAILDPSDGSIISKQTYHLGYSASFLGIRFIQTSDLDFVLIGDNTSPIKIGTRDIQVIKISGLDGSVIWSKNIGKAGAITFSAGIVETKDFDLVISGKTDHFHASYDMFVLKLSYFGELLWAYGYDLEPNQQHAGVNIAIDIDDHILVPGGKATITKLNHTDGSVISYRVVGDWSADEYTVGQHVITDLSDGSKFLLGNSKAGNPTHHRGVLMKFDFELNNCRSGISDDGFVFERRTTTWTVNDQTVGEMLVDYDFPSKISDGSGTFTFVDRMGSVEYEVHCKGIRCFGFDARQTDEVCSDGQGDCISDNVCSCQEFPARYGPYCNFTMCFGVLSNETSTVCSGHGDCVDWRNDKCECESGYFGYNCEIKEDECFGIDKNSIGSVCSGYGTCYGNNSCSCENGYMKYDCSMEKKKFGDYFGTFGDISSIYTLKQGGEYLYVYGDTDSYGESNPVNFQIFKIDLNGTLVGCKSQNDSSDLCGYKLDVSTDDPSLGIVVAFLYYETVSYVTLLDENSLEVKWSVGIRCLVDPSSNVFRLESIKWTKSGDILAAGSIKCPSLSQFSGDYVIAVVKISGDDGSLLMYETIGVEGSAGNTYTNDVIETKYGTSDQGDIVLVGRTLASSLVTGDALSDGFIIKLSSTGGIKWVKTLGLDESDSVSVFQSVNEMRSGDFVVAGSIGRNGLGYNALAARVSIDGDLQWVGVYDLQPDSLGGGFGSRAIEDLDGNIVLQIHLDTDATRKKDMLLLRLDPDNGQILSHQIFGGGGTVEYASDLIQDLADGSYFSVGLTKMREDEMVEEADYRFFLAKSDPDLSNCLGFKNSSRMMVKKDIGLEFTDHEGVLTINFTQPNVTEKIEGGPYEMVDRMPTTESHLICRSYSCFGIDFRNTTEVCSGNGDCVSPNVCSCHEDEDPFFYGPFCNFTMCFGVLSNETSTVCSGHGDCVHWRNDKCECESGYFGHKCEIKEDECFGIDKNSVGSVCSGHGTCFGNNSCVCQSGYMKYDCSMEKKKFGDYFGTFGDDAQIRHLKQGSDQFLYVSGYTDFYGQNNFQIFKFDPNGTLIACKSQNETFSIYGFDLDVSTFDPSLGIVVTYYRTEMSYVTLLYEDSLEVKWSVGMSCHEDPSNKAFRMKTLQWTKSGDILAAGQLTCPSMSPFTASSQYDLALLKISGEDGSLLMYETIGIAGNMYSYDVIETEFYDSSEMGGDIVLAGRALAPEMVTGASNEDGFIMKLSSTGRIKWVKTLGLDETNSALEIVSVEEMRSGDYIIAGFIGRDGSPDKNALAARVSIDGDLQWVGVYDLQPDSLGSGYGSRAIEDLDGNVVLSMYLETDSTRRRDMVLVRLDPEDGEILSYRVFGGGGTAEYGKDFIQDVTDGFYYTVGMTEMRDDEMVVENYRLFLAKSDPDFSNCLGYKNSSRMMVKKDIGLEFTDHEGVLTINFTQPNVTEKIEGGLYEMVDRMPTTESHLICRSYSCFGIDFRNTTEVCFGHGDCVSDDRCSCDEGSHFFGKYCNITKCYGIFSNDSSRVCSGKGSCVSTDACKCEANYYGFNCNITTCYNTFSNESGVCTNRHGTCVDHDRCQCNDGYHGYECDISECYDYLSNETNVCSGASRGVCSGPQNCTCIPPYLGHDCSRYRCYDIFNNETSTVCSGHGTCHGPDLCGCGTDWDQSKCDRFIGKCGVYSALETAFVCSGHGFCDHRTNPYSCNCTSGYLGSECGYWSCHGWGKDHSEVCSQKGACVDQNECDCHDGYYGTHCDEFYCGDYRNVEAGSVCSGHGNCISPGNCDCVANYTGVECQIEICFGIQKSSPWVCSSKGVCNGGVCLCQSGYKGSQCEQTYCSFHPTCYGHGTCIGADSCSCQKSAETGWWREPDCSSCVSGKSGVGCNLTLCSDPETFCHGHGECDGTDCICSGTFSSDSYCEECKSGYFDVSKNCTVMCDKVVNCSNHGECDVLSGECICYSSSSLGYFDAVSNCSVCEEYYYGSECKDYVKFEDVSLSSSLNEILGIEMKIQGYIGVSEIDCEKIFSNETILLFTGGTLDGKKYLKCSFPSNDENLVVSFSTEECLIVAEVSTLSLDFDVVMFPQFVSVDFGDSNPVSVDYVNTETPMVKINGEKPYGIVDLGVTSCSLLKVDSSDSLGSGYLERKWSSNDTKIQVYLESQQSTTSEVVSIPSNLLSKSSAKFLFFNLTSPLLRMSNFSVIRLHLLSSSIVKPVVTIRGPKVVKPSLPILLEAKLQINFTCLEDGEGYYDSLSYAWKNRYASNPAIIQFEPIDFEANNIVVNSRSIYIPPYLVKEGSIYSIYMETKITDGVRVEIVEPVADYTFSVETSPLECSIVGGSRTIIQERGVVLEGQFNDPDKLPNIDALCHWECQDEKTMGLCGFQNVVGFRIPGATNGEEFELTEGILADWNVDQNYQFSLLCFKGSRTCTDSVSLRLESSLIKRNVVLSVKVLDAESERKVINPKERIVFTAQMDLYNNETYSDFVYQWYLQIGSSSENMVILRGQELAKYVFTKFSFDESNNSTSIARSIGITDLGDIIPPSGSCSVGLVVSLPPGVLGGAELGRSVSSQYRMNSRPKYGYCLVLPESGYSLTTEFSVTCNNWYDSETPLAYSFYYYLPTYEQKLIANASFDSMDEFLLSEEEDWVPISMNGYSPSEEFIIPVTKNGSVYVMSRICDSLGSCVEEYSDEILISTASNSTDEDLISETFKKWMIQSQNSILDMLRALLNLVEMVIELRGEPGSGINEKLEKLIENLKKEILVRLEEIQVMMEGIAESEETLHIKLRVSYFSAVIQVQESDLAKQISNSTSSNETASEGEVETSHISLTNEKLKSILDSLVRNNSKLFTPKNTGYGLGILSKMFKNQQLIYLSSINESISSVEDPTVLNECSSFLKELMEIADIMIAKYVSEKLVSGIPEPTILFDKETNMKTVLVKEDPEFFQNSSFSFNLSSLSLGDHGGGDGLKNENGFRIRFSENFFGDSNNGAGQKQISLVLNLFPDNPHLYSISNETVEKSGIFEESDFPETVKIDFYSGDPNAKDATFQKIKKSDGENNGKYYQFDIPGHFSNWEKKYRKKPVCSWFDEPRNKFRGDGCRLVSIFSNKIRCECNHTTDFTALFEDYLTELNWLTAEDFENITKLNIDNVTTLVVCVIVMIIYLSVMVLIEMVQMTCRCFGLHCSILFLVLECFKCFHKLICRVRNRSKVGPSQKKDLLETKNGKKKKSTRKVFRMIWNIVGEHKYVSLLCGGDEGGVSMGSRWTMFVFDFYAMMLVNALTFGIEPRDAIQFVITMVMSNIIPLPFLFVLNCIFLRSTGSGCFRRRTKISEEEMEDLKKIDQSIEKYELQKQLKKKQKKEKKNQRKKEMSRNNNNNDFEMKKEEEHEEELETEDELFCETNIVEMKSRESEVFSDKVLLVEEFGEEGEIIKRTIDVQQKENENEKLSDILETKEEEVKEEKEEEVDEAEIVKNEVEEGNVEFVTIFSEHGEVEYIEEKEEMESEKEEEERISETELEEIKSQNESVEEEEEEEINESENEEENEENEEGTERLEEEEIEKEEHTNHANEIENEENDNEIVTDLDDNNNVSPQHSEKDSEEHYKDILNNAEKDDNIMNVIEQSEDSSNEEEQDELNNNNNDNENNNPEEEEEGGEIIENIEESQNSSESSNYQTEEQNMIKKEEEQNNSKKIKSEKNEENEEEDFSLIKKKGMFEKMIMSTKYLCCCICINIDGFFEFVDDAVETVTKMVKLFSKKFWWSGIFFVLLFFVVYAAVVSILAYFVYHEMSWFGATGVLIYAIIAFVFFILIVLAMYFSSKTKKYKNDFRPKKLRRKWHGNRCCCMFNICCSSLYCLFSCFVTLFFAAMLGSLWYYEPSFIEVGLGFVLFFGFMTIVSVVWVIFHLFPPKRNKNKYQMLMNRKKKKGCCGMIKKFVMFWVNIKFPWFVKYLNYAMIWVAMLGMIFLLVVYGIKFDSEQDGVSDKWLLGNGMSALEDMVIQEPIAIFLKSVILAVIMYFFEVVFVG